MQKQDQYNLYTVFLSCYISNIPNAYLNIRTIILALFQYNVILTSTVTTLIKSMCISITVQKPTVKLGQSAKLYVERNVENFS